MPSVATAFVVVMISFVSAYLYVISSFGNAILFHLLWQVCAAGNSKICSGNVAEAVLYITISAVCSTIIQTCLCKSYINWPLGLQLALSQLVGGLFGTLLLFTVTSVWIVRSLGLFFLLISFQSIVREAKIAVATDIAKRNAAKTDDELHETINPLQVPIEPGLITQDIISPTSLAEASATTVAVASPMMELHHKISSPNNRSVPPVLTVGNTQKLDHAENDSYKVDTWERRAFVWAVGIAAGFLGGLFGTGGPPLMLFVTHVQLPKNVARGTLSLGFCAVSFERLFLFLIYPPSGLDVYSDDKILMYDLIIIATLSSIYLGNISVKYVSESHFRRLIMCILSAGSVIMIASGTSVVLQLSMCAASLMLFGLVGFGTYKHYYRSAAVEFTQIGLPWYTMVDKLRASRDDTRRF